jgi:hypothetical protein
MAALSLRTPSFKTRPKKNNICFHPVRLGHVWRGTAQWPGASPTTSEFTTTYTQRQPKSLGYFTYVHIQRLSICIYLDIKWVGLHLGLFFTNSSGHPV